MKRLTQLRGDRTLTTLGFDARVHPSRIGQMELGRIVPPRSSVELKRLARALGWPEERAGELLDEATGDE